MQIKEILMNSDENISFDVTAIAARFRIRKTKNQNQYLEFILIDSTGEMLVRKWSFDLFDQNNLLDPSKHTTIILNCLVRKSSYNNRFQYTVENYEINTEAEVEDYFLHAPYPVKTMWKEFETFLPKITDHDYQKLLQTLLADKEVVEQFKIHRAGVSNHHNVYGGLLQHTLTMLKTAEQIVMIYRHLAIDQSLLYTAIILHDWAKLREISSRFVEARYTVEGRLIGHISLGAQMVEKLTTKTLLPTKKSLLLKHCILASHGKMEFGSPVHPAIIEALILSKIDDLDAKLDTCYRALTTVEKDGFTTNRYPDFASQGFYDHINDDKFED